MKRVQLSGSAKRKAAVTKQQVNEKTLPNKISTFFNTVSRSVPAVPRPPVLDVAQVSVLQRNNAHDHEEGEAETSVFTAGAQEELENEPQQSTTALPAPPPTVAYSDTEDPDTNMQDVDMDKNMGSASAEIFDSTDPAFWPRAYDSMVSYWLHVGPDSCRNRDAIYKNSVRQSENMRKNKRSVVVNRRLNDSAFQSHSPNGEMIQRHWLLYSPSTGCVFCFVCKLFCPDSSSTLAGKGFDNWASISRLTSHEMSPEHRQSCASYATRVSKIQIIDKQIADQYEGQCKYWRDVLRRVVSTVKFLASRGLAFRGDNELFGDHRNGNFLGCLELLAEYDTFLAQHITTYGNAGRGTASYLSSTTVDEFIHLMAQRLLNTIVTKIKAAKYFSFSVDSTPDVTHHDQLTFTVRYVCNDSMLPTERFLKFVNIISHTGLDLFDVIVDTFLKLSVDLSDCRGQTYDNAANMSGKYSGVQARILESNSKAVYVPCMGHSLNLSGVAAADSCIDAVNFFGFVQELYSFMSASTYRWKLLEDAVTTAVDAGHSSVKRMPKKISDTRWSARADALESLVLQYKAYLHAVENLAGDELQKSDTRLTARSLVKNMLTLEYAFLATFWNVILSRVDKTSKLLQDPTLQFGVAVQMLKSLKDFLQLQRDKFEEFLEAAKSMCGHSDWKEKRPHKRKRMADESSEPELTQTCKAKFKTTVFYVIVDTIVSDLQRRINAYAVIEKRFAFLSIDQANDSVRTSLMEVVGFYEGDIDIGIIDEWTQWSAFVKGLEQQWPTPAEMLSVMVQSKIQSAFPNVFILLRIYLTLPVSNCTGERSFSHLKRIKNYLRSMTGQNRLSDLAILNIESDDLATMDFTELINVFAAAKSRRRAM